MKSRPWLFAAAILFAAILVYMLMGGFSRGVAVEASQAKTGVIREFIDEQAKTRLPQTYLVTMPFSGRIEPITLTEGTAVEKGQVVAQMVARDLKLAVEQANAATERLEASIKENADVTVEETAYKQALQFVKSNEAAVQAAAERMTAGKAKLEFAIREMKRARELGRVQAMQQQDLERTELQQVQSDVDYRQDQLVHAAISAMAAATNLMPTMVRQYIQRKTLTGDVLHKQKAEAEARLQQVLQEQERGTMRSPVQGVVLERPISNERFLPAGTTLLEIGRLEDLEIEADILTLDVSDAKVGDAVEIYGPAIGRPAANGSVVRIFPAGFTKVSSLGVEQQRVKVIIRFADGELKRLLADRHLGVGYRVRVKIFTAGKQQALLVPRSALFRGADGRWQVFAVRRGLARLQVVEVGLLNDEQAEISSGLQEGEAVILTPESTLVDGTKVDAALR